MLIGSHWPELRYIWRHYIVHRVSTAYGHRIGLEQKSAEEKAIQTAKTRPPANVNFLIDRFDEFMYLMLGETVLSLILAPRDSSGNDSHEVEHYWTMFFGFVIVVGMMFTYQVIEPRHAEDHAFRRSLPAAVAYLFLFSFKTVSVLFVGVGIKLAIYNPDASPSCHFAFDQRLQLATALAVCFGLELLMRPLHIGLKRYYSCRTLLRRHPLRALVIALRVAFIVAMLLLALAPLVPFVFLGLQTLFTVVECILAYYQHFVLSRGDLDEYVEKKAKRRHEHVFGEHGFTSHHQIGALG